MAICSHEFPLDKTASSDWGQLPATSFQYLRKRTHSPCESYVYVIDSFSTHAKFFKYIAIHARRANDFTVYCNGVPKEDCFPSTATYQRRIREIQEETQERLGVVPHHVVMLSDEEDPAWWDSIRELGWFAPNHVADDTINKYGRW